MTFYILFEGDTEQNTIFDENKLGEVSFEKFHPNRGFKILKNLVKEESAELGAITIIDQTGKEYGVEEFLNYIGKYSFGIIPE